MAQTRRHSQVFGLANSKGSLMFPNTWEWRHRSFPGGSYRVFVCVFFLWTLNWGVVLVAE